MKSVFLVHSLRKGGAERLLLELASNLSCTSVTVISWLDNNEFLEEEYQRVEQTISALFVSIIWDNFKQRPYQSCFEMFLVILTVGFLYAIVSQTRLMHIMSNGDLCFTVEEHNDEHSYFDGNFGKKLSPSSELCLFVLSSFGK